LLGNPEGKRPVGRPRCKGVDNIEMDLGKRGWDGMDWIGLAQDRHKWRALVLAFLEPSVDRGDECSNLNEEYCECFQPISLHLLIYPKYSLICHYAQHCAHIQGLHHLAKMTAAHSVDHYDIHKANMKMFMPLISLRFLHCCITTSFSSLCNVYEEICVVKHNIYVLASCS
jgi:hypothetical protein